jgi:rhodanese-related sulfurtransferase
MHPRFRHVSLSILSGFLALGVVMFAGANEKKSDGSPATKPAAVKKLTLDEFDKARQEKGVLVLDVRSTAEFAHGHIANAVSVPISGPGAEEFEKRVSTIDRNKPILVHCLRGTRSAKAVEKMKAMGFTNLSDFAGGYSAWTQAGKPVEEGNRGGELPPNDSSKK